MIDVLSVAESAVRQGTWSAPVLVTAAGITAGIGPCAASRGAVLATFVASASRWRAAGMLAAFGLGTGACYALLGLFAAAAGRITAAPSFMYYVAAPILIVAGMRELLRERTACSHERTSLPSLGAAFSTGTVSAALLSPCCTPLLLPILVSTTQSGGAAGKAAMLFACFAVGHASPGIAGAALSRIASVRWTLGPAAYAAAQTVTGAVMIAMGLYYGVLA